MKPLRVTRQRQTLWRPTNCNFVRLSTNFQIQSKLSKVPSNISLMRSPLGAGSQ